VNVAVAFAEAELVLLTVPHGTVTVEEAVQLELAEAVEVTLVHDGGEHGH